MKPAIGLRVRFAIQRFYHRTFRRINRLGYLRRLVNNTKNLDEIDDEMDELAALETEHWQKRGVKVHVFVQDIPLPEGEKTRYRDGNYGQYLIWEVLRQFRKSVEDAEYERNKRKREWHELRVKWFTAIVAAIAAIAGLVNLYLTYKSRTPTP